MDLCKKRLNSCDSNSLLDDDAFNNNNQCYSFSLDLNFSLYRNALTSESKAQVLKKHPTLTSTFKLNYTLRAQFPEFHEYANKVFVLCFFQRPSTATSTFPLLYPSGLVGLHSCVLQSDVNETNTKADGLLNLWTALMCICRPFRLEARWPHSSHTKGFSPRCLAASCTRSSVRLKKVLGHSGHWNTPGTRHQLERCNVKSGGHLSSSTLPPAPLPKPPPTAAERRLTACGLGKLWALIMWRVRLFLRMNCSVQMEHWKKKKEKDIMWRVRDACDVDGQSVGWAHRLMQCCFYIVDTYWRLDYLTWII